MKRDSFIFYRSFFESISELSDDIQLTIFKAISEYSLNFNEIELTGIAKTIFILIKPQLDANNKRYMNGKKPKKSKTEANKNANKNDNNNDNKNEEVKPLNQSFKNFVDWFNNKFNKNFKALDKLKSKYDNALKIFTKQELFIACENAYKDKYHKENNFKYLTIEFILRPDKIDMFLNKEKVNTPTSGTISSSIRGDIDLNNYIIPHADWFGYKNEDLLDRCENGKYELK